jgi:hypothetical protein
LPRHLGVADTVAVELLVTVHGNRHPQQPPGEFERRIDVSLSELMALLPVVAASLIPVRLLSL